MGINNMILLFRAVLFDSINVIGRQAVCVMDNGTEEDIVAKIQKYLTNKKVFYDIFMMFVSLLQVKKKFKYLIRTFHLSQLNTMFLRVNKIYNFSLYLKKTKRNNVDLLIVGLKTGSENKKCIPFFILSFLSKLIIE